MNCIYHCHHVKKQYKKKHLQKFFTINFNVYIFLNNINIFYYNENKLFYKQ